MTYAGQALTTGKQAECYANNFIGLHLKSTADGKTYAELGTVQSTLRTQVTEAQKTNAANLADLQKQLADTTAARETVFKGETLRGLLLTSYGFSEFGAKAAQAATVAYVASGLMLILALFGFIHAFVTPKTKAFAAPEPGQSAIGRDSTGNRSNPTLRRGPATAGPLRIVAAGSRPIATVPNRGMSNGLRYRMLRLDGLAWVRPLLVRLAGDCGGHQSDEVAAGDHANGGAGGVDDRYGVYRIPCIRRATSPTVASMSSKDGRTSSRSWTRMTAIAVGSEAHAAASARSPMTPMHRPRAVRHGQVPTPGP